MNEANRQLDVLNLECVLFSHYLRKQDPAEYVVAKYVEAHETKGVFSRREANSMDSLLLRIAVLHPFATRLVDAYTSIFFRTSLTRKKWILLLAILESCAPSHQYFDLPDPRRTAAVVVGILWKLSGFLITLAASSILFMPLHLFFSAKAKLLGRYYLAGVKSEV
jgi:hypothetical protein